LVYQAIDKVSIVSVIFSGHTDLTLTDLLTLFGGTVATWTYKLYNENYAPYTSTDIEVLQTVREPELILYTWGNDPRTSDKDDNVTHVHRLGIYDWIPKMHQLALSTLTSLAIDLPTALWIEDNTKAHRSTQLTQSFNVFVNIMIRAGYYPFTQLDTNDPEKIAHSKRFPDKRFLEWWLIQVFGDFFKMLGPVLPEAFNSYPNAQLFNLAVVTVPSVAFGLKVQIDSVRQVNKMNDTARKVAVHVSWVSQLTSWISSLVPFFKPQDHVSSIFGFKIAPPFVLSHQTLIYLQYSRNAINFLSNLIKNHILMANHIVGLLSSSYQGGACEGGKRKEVLEMEEMRARSFSKNSS
jgi:hypothetical protein